MLPKKAQAGLNQFLGVLSLELQGPEGGLGNKGCDLAKIHFALAGQVMILQAIYIVKMDANNAWPESF